MFSLFIDYNKWHYTQALVNIFILAREFMRFFFNLFSVHLFFRSLLQPIFSIPVDDISSENVSDVVAVFLGGIILRIVGAIFRMFFILIGLLLCVITFVLFVLIFFIWIIIPLIFITIVYYFISLSLLII